MTASGKFAYGISSDVREKNNRLILTLSLLHAPLALILSPAA